MAWRGIEKINTNFRQLWATVKLTSLNESVNRGAKTWKKCTLLCRDARFVVENHSQVSYYSLQFSHEKSSREEITCVFFYKAERLLGRVSIWVKGLGINIRVKFE